MNRLAHIAQNMASKSVTRPFRVGAVIARGSFILGCGRSNYVDHTRRVKGDYIGDEYFSIHAEVDACLKARGDLHGATIYVFAEAAQTRRPVRSKPCPKCRVFLPAQRD